MNHEQFDESRIENAFRELRSEEVPFGGRRRTLEIVAGPQEKGYAVRVAIGAATGACVVSALFLWPQQKALAWSQVVSKTLQRYHAVSYFQNGKDDQWRRGMEEWVDGPKYSMEFPKRTGSRYDIWHMVMRYDGRRMFSMRNRGESPDYGVVLDFKSQYGSHAERYSLDWVLKNEHIQPKGDPVAVKLNGKDSLKYMASFDHQNLDQLVFYVDPETKAIFRWERDDKSGKLLEYTDIERPDSIPDGQFEPVPGIRIYDLNKDATQIRQRMLAGTPIGEGNVLRAVTVAPGRRDLEVAWTGTSPNADGTPHARIEGFQSNRVYSAVHFGPSELKPNFLPPSFGGKPLYVLAFTLERPVGNTVNLDMPILVLDKKRPVLGSHGQILGYRSKKIGTKRITNVPVKETLPETIGMACDKAWTFRSQRVYRR